MIFSTLLLVTTTAFHPGDSDSVSAIPKGTKIISIREMNILPNTNAIIFMRGQDPVQVTDWKGVSSFANIEPQSEGADELVCALTIIPSTTDRILPRNFEVIEGSAWFMNKPEPIEIFSLKRGAKGFESRFVDDHSSAYYPHSGVKKGNYLYIPGKSPGIVFGSHHDRSSIPEEADLEFEAPFESFKCRSLAGLKKIPNEKLLGLFVNFWELVRLNLPEQRRYLADYSLWDQYKILVPASQAGPWEPSGDSMEVTIGELTGVIYSSFELKFPPARVIGE